MVVEDFEQRPLRVEVAFRGVLKLQDAVYVAEKAATRMRTNLPSTLLDRIRSYAKDIDSARRQLRERNLSDTLAAPAADRLYKLSLELQYCIRSLICITGTLEKSLVECDEIIDRLEGGVALTWRNLYDAISMVRRSILPLSLKAKREAPEEWRKVENHLNSIIGYINTKIAERAPLTPEDRSNLAMEVRTLKEEITQLIVRLARQAPVSADLIYRRPKAPPITPAARTIDVTSAPLNLERRVLVSVDGREFEVKTPFIIGRHDDRLELCIRSLGRYRVEDAAVFAAAAQRLRMKTREFPPVICTGVPARQVISRLQLLVFYHPGRGLSIIATGRRKMDIYYEENGNETLVSTAGYYSGEIVNVGSWARVEVMELNHTIYLKLLE